VNRVVTVRHGATDWSAEGRHTGWTDIPLSADGQKQAAALKDILRGWRFTQVLVSPLQRARETCRLAGFGEHAVVLNDLREWNYGDYEGLTSPQVAAMQPGWSLWRDGCPGGENAAAVGRRADRVVQRLRSVNGDSAVFAHGHILRVVAARWLGEAPEAGRFYALGTAAINVLGYEHEEPVLSRWNWKKNLNP
jgi:probable phosphoglycerate mutase